MAGVGHPHHGISHSFTVPSPAHLTLETHHRSVLSPQSPARCRPQPTQDVGEGGRKRKWGTRVDCQRTEVGERALGEGVLTPALPCSSEFLADLDPVLGVGWGAGRVLRLVLLGSSWARSL